MDGEQGHASSGSSSRGNETGLASALTAESIVTVQTTNFHRVLDHFDSDGNLIDDKRTLLSIPCAICHMHNLSLINRHLNDSAGTTHEHYIVLMRCGHAFGYKCINNWFLVRRLDELKCPLCSTPVFCERNHILPLEIYGGTTDMDVQCQQIKEIREFLTNPTCEQCSSTNSDNAALYSPSAIVRDVWLIRSQVYMQEIYLRHLESRLQAIRVAALRQQGERRILMLQAHVANRYDGPRLLPPIPPRGSDLSRPPQTAPDRRVYWTTPPTANTPRLDQHHWHQPTTERNTRAATFPPPTPGNSEDQAGATTLTFGYPYVQSPDRYWEL
ncbi:hypothetical protein F4782DRAFT_530293 [Xylaria castorea]|nr:hypothetical protein F4782DRAFT_530293 [Xylaria castorea]